MTDILSQLKKERKIINDHTIQADSLKVMRTINDEYKRWYK